MSNKFKAGEEAKLPPTPPVELRQASPMLTEAQISVSLIAGYFFSPAPPSHRERESHSEEMGLERGHERLLLGEKNQVSKVL